MNKKERDETYPETPKQTPNNKSSKNKKNSHKKDNPLKELPPKKKPKEPIPSIETFLERTKNPIKKLRQGQGYDQELGLTYIGTFPEVAFGHYGISHKKSIRAFHESNEMINYTAHDIRVLGGFTDPLTDKTLVLIKTLLNQLHKEGKIESKALSVVAENIISKSCHYLDFPTQLDRIVFVFWILGTYLRAIFNWYPYLCFEGLRDVGKSTALEFLSLTCFNGGGNVSGGYTEADLHKAAASTMGFFSIDHLEEKFRSDDKRNVLNEFLENAWKLNSYVSKRDQNTGEQLRLPLACSVALGTRRITETIAEKGLVIRMEETDNNELRERSITMYKDEYFQQLEGELIAVALNYQDKIIDAYENIKVIPGLGREYNKFIPLLAIAQIIDNETDNSKEYFRDLKKFAIDYRKNRKDEHEDTEEILLRLILRENVDKATYKELANLMANEGYDYSWHSAKADINKLKIVKKYIKKRSPIKLHLDLERAQKRAKARGIKLEAIESSDGTDYKLMDNDELQTRASIGDQKANEELEIRIITKKDE